MINRVNVAEAKRRFSDLLGRVAYGKERVIITRRGRPMAILIPPDQERQEPHLADARGWLEERNAFFGTMAQIVEERLTHQPRPLRR